MPFTVLLSILTTLAVHDATPVRPQPGLRAKPAAFWRSDARMPIYLRALAAQQNRRLLAKRAEKNARSGECGSGTQMLGTAWARPRNAGQPGIIVGRVKDPGGGAIDGARVTVSSLQLVTASSSGGRFQLAIPGQRLAAIEDLTITVNAIGYRPTRQRLTLAPGDSARVALTLCRQTLQRSLLAMAGTAEQGQPGPSLRR